MGRHLVNDIAEQTRAMLRNVETAIHTCDIGYVLCGMSVWKHVYHTLYSCDKWFINPVGPYTEPAFHQPGLHSLDDASATTLSREVLLAYLHTIENKLEAYLADLADAELSQKPDGCPFTRMTLILGQMRHFNVHLGNINAATMVQSGQWPRVVGLEGPFDGGLYE